MHQEKQKTIAIVAIAALMIFGFAYATPLMHNDHIALAKKKGSKKTTGCSPSLPTPSPTLVP
jgi:hypothetical protein